MAFKRRIIFREYPNMMMDLSVAVFCSCFRAAQSEWVVKSQKNNINFLCSIKRDTFRVRNLRRATQPVLYISISARCSYTKINNEISFDDSKIEIFLVFNKTTFQCKSETQKCCSGMKEKRFLIDYFLYFLLILLRLVI